MINNKIQQKTRETAQNICKTHICTEFSTRDINRNIQRKTKMYQKLHYKKIMLIKSTNDWQKGLENNMYKITKFPTKVFKQTYSKIHLSNRQKRYQNGIRNQNNTLQNNIFSHKTHSQKTKTKHITRTHTARKVKHALATISTIHKTRSKYYNILEQNASLHHFITIRRQMNN